MKDLHLPLLILLFLVAFLVGAVPAHAHDGYEGLKTNQGGDCCGGGDCGPVEERMVDGQLQAHIIGPPWSTAAAPIDIWVDVPAWTEKSQEENPKAGPSVCWLPNRGVICSWRGREF